MCRSFRAECAERIQQLVDCEWPQTFLARGPEHACRIAAVLCAYRQRAGIAGTGDVIDDQSLQDGITLARWFSEEMVRIAPEAGADEVAQAARILSRALWEASVDPDGQGRNRNGTVSISVSVKNRRGLRGLEQKPDLLEKVKRALINGDHIAFPDSGKTTQCLVNPHLSRMYQPEA